MTLGNLKAKDALPKLIALLDDRKEEDMVSAESARALGKIADPQAIPHLLDALYDDRIWVRPHAADALRAIAPTAAIMKPYAKPERFRAIMDKLESIPLPSSKGDWNPEGNHAYWIARQIDALSVGLFLTLPETFTDNDRTRASNFAQKILTNSAYPDYAFGLPTLASFSRFCQTYQPTLYANRTRKP